MINSIIFSFNRPLQLRLLLESIKRNATDKIGQPIFNINIIYKYSDEKFKKGYEKLQNEKIISDINWVHENNFKEDVLALFDEKYEYTNFFTDNDIVYNKIIIKDIINSFNDPNLFCFSLKLGENVTWCYMMRCDNLLRKQESVSENVIKWDWKKHYLDFGYPWSVNTHVFKTKDIFKLIKKVSFNNLNYLENNLQIFDNFPKNKMASFKHSVAVNVPINNTIDENHSIEREKESKTDFKKFNDIYLSGKIINYENLNFNNITGCYQELSFSYKNK